MPGDGSRAAAWGGPAPNARPSKEGTSLRRTISARAFAWLFIFATIGMVSITPGRHDRSLDPLLIDHRAQRRDVEEDGSPFEPGNSGSSGSRPTTRAFRLGIAVEPTRELARGVGVVDA